MRLLLLLAVSASLDAAVGTECASCHAKEVAGYQRTAMARSLSSAAVQPAGSFMHTASGSRFRITTSAAGMKQTVERDGYKAEYPVDYVIGSGNHAFGYLVRIDGFLFQSPLSYYSRRKVWDVAPGYESSREPDFTRPVTAECVVCHSGQPRPVYNSLNRFGDPPFAVEAIGCDRCHGPVTEHLKAPSAKNVVNPAKLAPRARDSVCEQCHLGGEARIPNPGRRIAEFTPGQDLEQIFSVYVYQQPPARGLKVVSHVEQLALSVCAMKSEGKLWCGTCHNPHDPPAEASAAAAYDGRCRSCHATVAGAVHQKAAKPCVECHMAKRPAKDGGHTAFTDHRIARKPSTDTGHSLGKELRAWNPPPAQYVDRNLGLANVVIGDREESAFHFDAGYRLLAGAHDQFAKDPAVLTSLGVVLMRKRRPAEAAGLYRQALELQPDYAPYHVNLATALKEAGQLDLAVTHYERAIELDPSIEQAYRRLAEIHAVRNAPQRARQVLDRYLRFMPGNIGARIARDLQ